MQVTKEQIDPCTIALDINVDPETVTGAFDRAYREFGKFTNVPGFRPGKAPRKMLERYVNQERLRERVMELVAAPAYRDALKEQEITPYADPEVEFSDLAEGQEFKFRTLVPMPPQVELGDYSDISVERPVYAISDEDVNREIEALRADRARIETVEDRGVQDGDVVIAETSIAMEGEEMPEEPRRSLIRIGENIPGFDEAVTGQKPEEERTFELTYPEDYDDKERAGKKATFKVKILSINQRVLPELTDEWVREVSPFESVDDLRNSIREQREKDVKELSDRIAEGRIVEELIKRSTINFPSVMRDEEIQADLHELGHDLERRGIDYDKYLELTNQTQEQHQASLAEKADERIKSVLVLRDLARKEGIDVSDDEVNAEIGRLAADNNLTGEDADRLAADDRRRNQVANMVVKRKLRDFLFEKAKIKDVPAKAEENVQ